MENVHDLFSGNTQMTLKLHLYYYHILYGIRVKEYGIYGDQKVKYRKYPWCQDCKSRHLDTVFYALE
jgi:hypothetical protein